MYTISIENWSTATIENWSTAMSCPHYLLFPTIIFEDWVQEPTTPSALEQILSCGLRVPDQVDK